MYICSYLNKISSLFKRGPVLTRYKRRSRYER